ncbi:Protein PHLOEM PROTEIN 2-LIKE A1, partial [Mucuna pruriens]
MGASESYSSRQNAQQQEPSKNSSQTEDVIGRAGKALKGVVQHEYEHILKDADSPLDKSSSWKNQLKQLYDGVLLDCKTKAKKKSNANCFMLYAKALSITWGETSHYWQWIQQKEERYTSITNIIFYHTGTMIEVAKLLRVCWLEVRGKFDAEKLSPGIIYQVSFIVMLKNSGDGWDDPINFRLVLPGGKKVEKRECLKEKPRDKWTEIQVGEFEASKNDVGEMEISMYEFDSGRWKSGLLIQGVSIKPKN